MLWSNGSNTALKDQFDQSTAEFNLIATALLKGLPEVDVAAAPTAEINDALIEVLADWEQEVFFLNRVASGADVSRDEVEWVNQALNLKTAKMEAILAMYADYSRRAIP